MKYEPIFSPEYVFGLFEIEFYLREFEGDNRADKVLASIDQEVERILQNPFQYQQYGLIDPPDANTRRAIVHRSYIIVFHIVDFSVLILRIYHGKQNII